jgi:DNA-binding response OmpR family regulator
MEPAGPGSAKHRDTQTPASAAASAELLRVLVVDDDPAVLDVLSAALAHGGYAAQTAASGPEAVRLFEADRPAAVLLDLCLPKMDGFAVFAAARRIDPGVPVVIITAMEPEEDVVRDLRHHGAFDYLEKPVDLAHLLVIVDAATCRAELGARAVPSG